MASMRSLQGKEGTGSFKSALAASHDAVSGPVVKLGASRRQQGDHSYSSPQCSLELEPSWECLQTMKCRGAKVEWGRVLCKSLACWQRGGEVGEAGGPQASETRKVDVQTLTTATDASC